VLRVIPYVVVVFGVLLCSACCLPVDSKPETKQGDVKNNDDKAKIDPIPRTLLETRFIGKSKSDLRDAFGPPDQTKVNKTGDLWIYKAVSVDPNSSKIDGYTYFYFHPKLDEIREIRY